MSAQPQNCPRTCRPSSSAALTCTPSIYPACTRQRVWVPSNKGKQSPHAQNAKSAAWQLEHMLHNMLLWYPWVVAPKPQCKDCAARQHDSTVLPRRTNGHSTAQYSKGAQHTALGIAVQRQHTAAPANHKPCTRPFKLCQQLLPCHHAWLHTTTQYASNCTKTGWLDPLQPLHPCYPAATPAPAPSVSL